MRSLGTRAVAATGATGLAATLVAGIAFALVAGSTLRTAPRGAAAVGPPGPGTTTSHGELLSGRGVALKAARADKPASPADGLPALLTMGWQQTAMESSLTNRGKRGTTARAGRAGSAQGQKDHREPDRVTMVRGNWLGDLPCAPTSAAVQPDLSTHVTCVAATGYAGAFTGHSYLTMTGDIAADGSTHASYEETIYALYLGDHSYGSIHVVGALTTDAQLGFHAQGRITGGTCGFSGSTGTISYEGTTAGGGFVAEWHRPVTVPSDAACVPPVP